MKTIRFLRIHPAALGFATLMLAGCAGNTPSQDPLATQCTEPRPEACTLEYLPVCATLADGSQATYASACSACSDPAVVSHVEEQCP
jgi:hypothetical protein